MKEPDVDALMSRLPEYRFQQWLAFLEWRNMVMNGDEKLPVVVKKLSAEETVAHILGQISKGA